jgi:hypothetical protein
MIVKFIDVMGEEIECYHEDDQWHKSKQFYIKKFGIKNISPEEGNKDSIIILVKKITGNMLSGYISIESMEKDKTGKNKGMQLQIALD